MIIGCCRAFPIATCCRQSTRLFCNRTNESSSVWSRQDFEESDVIMTRRSTSKPIAWHISSPDNYLQQWEWVFPSTITEMAQQMSKAIEDAKEQRTSIQLQDESVLELLAILLAKELCRNERPVVVYYPFAAQAVRLSRSVGHQRIHVRSLDTGTSTLKNAWVILVKPPWSPEVQRLVARSTLEGCSMVALTSTRKSRSWLSVDFDPPAYQIKQDEWATILYVSSVWHVFSGSKYLATCRRQPTRELLSRIRDEFDV